MSLSTPTRVSVPFAVSGLKATIPASSNNTTGRAGYDQGFPPINMTAKTAGGIPPFGQDFNGILYDVTLALRYMEAGSGFVYDSAFSTAIGGYKVGAMIPRTDGAGFWLSTVDATTTDPEVSGSDAAGWRPVATAGTAAITMTNANVTLTPLQWGKPIIVITGTLTANVNLIFPTMPGQWTVRNATSGAFSITCKTSAGTGVIVPAGSSSVVGDGTNIYGISGASAGVSYPQIQPVTSSVAANALSVGLNATALDFRSSSLTNGVPSTVAISSPLALTVPSGATLGTVSGQTARLVLLAINNAGTAELAIVNLAGGNNLDETTLISTTAISAGATLANVIYSTTARSNLPFRVVGFFDITETTAGTWATDATTKQGVGGQALSAMSSLGYGQTWQVVTGSRAFGTTYYNITGRPIEVKVSATTGSGSGAVTCTINGVAVPFGGWYSEGSFTNFVGHATIPAGASYNVASPGTLVSWVELR